MLHEQNITRYALEQLTGYDFLAQAMGGLMSVTGEADGRPLKVGAAVVDLVYPDIDPANVNWSR